VFGYLSGSLADELMSDFDRAIIKSARFRCRKWIRKAKTIFRNGNNTSPSPQDSDDNIQSPRSQAWKHAVSRFILSLSDQQLVTGLAILISGVANQRSLTAWEFSNVLSLAWFSTTSHLATLDALQPYLKAYTRIRDIRVGGMVLVQIFLIYTFVVATVAMSFKHQLGGDTYPIQCIFGQLTQVHETNLLRALDISARAFTLMIVISASWARCFSLYSKHRSSVHFYAWLFPWKDEEFVGEVAPGLSFDELHEVRLAVSRSKYLATAGTTLNKRKRIWASANYLVSESFFASLGDVAFSLSYGIAQLVRYRWIDAPKLDEDAKSM
jgi:hypothetical protein